MWDWMYNAKFKFCPDKLGVLTVLWCMAIKQCKASCKPPPRDCRSWRRVALASFRDVSGSINLFCANCLFTQIKSSKLVWKAEHKQIRGQRSNGHSFIHSCFPETSCERIRSAGFPKETSGYPSASDNRIGISENVTGPSLNHYACSCPFKTIVQWECTFGYTRCLGNPNGVSVNQCIWVSGERKHWSGKWWRIRWLHRLGTFPPSCPPIIQWN